MDTDNRNNPRYHNQVSPAGSSECHVFGIVSGCHPDCPVYQRGECDVQELNREIFGEER
jgi:hypothetical protein